MTNHQEGSSFNDPAGYHQYSDQARRALERYQWFRRPFMFHLFLVVLVFYPIEMIFAVPLLGMLYPFRHLEDGFDAESKRKFRIRMRIGMEKGGVIDGIIDYLRTLKWMFFNRTWMFYLFMASAPVAGVFLVFWRGFKLILDLFFLRCWDIWIDNIEWNKPEEPREIELEGGEILDIPASSISPIKWALREMAIVKAKHKELKSHSRSQRKRRSEEDDS